MDYFFISFISLCIYYSIFVLIRNSDLTGQYSVKNDSLRYYRIYRITGGRKGYTSEISAGVESIDKNLGQIYSLKFRLLRLYNSIL